jgi:hypothetical protein
VTRATGCWVLLALVGALHAAAARPTGNSGRCTETVASFDGVEPLRYAVVIGAPEQRTSFTRQLPVGCAADAQHCDSPGARYLLTGDMVAVASTCGRFAYAQYLGKESVSTGWIEEQRLHYGEVKLPFDDGGPPASMRYFKPGRIPMRLVKGRGIPVCEAYLQRVNSTLFYAPPYCGRPDNDQIPGFTRLRRAALTPDQIKSLWGQLHALVTYGHAEPEIPMDAYDLASATRAQGAGDFFGAWRYEPQIDITNSGRPTNVVVWSGQPAGAEQFSGYCGVPHEAPRESHSARGLRTIQVAFVASNDAMTLDEADTRRLFGHPTGGLPVPNNTRLRSHFQFLGDSMDVFEYRGEYYIDTFFWDSGWADFDGKRSNDSELMDHLAVVHRSDDKFRELCEYAYDPDRSLSPLGPRP